MKQFKNLTYMLLLGAGLMFTACEEDGGLIDPPGVGTTGPEVLVHDGTLQQAPDVELAPGGNFTVYVEAIKQDLPMNSFTVKEDGVAIDLSRVLINGDPSGGNPALLFENEKDGFNWEITVFAHDDAALRTYSFEVADDEGNIGSGSILVDTDASGGTTPPDVTSSGSDNITLEPSTLYSFRISANPVSGRLASMAVYQNDELISDISRLEFAGNDFDSNPYALPEALKDGFVDEQIFIRIQDSGSATYRIVIADEFGNASEITKTVQTGSSGTPTTTLTGILLNQAGPSGTGGLDLDTGNSTGSADLDAEIRDMGIDAGPVATNWLQQIAGINGSTVRALVAGQNGLLESFSFESVSVVEEISAIHNANGIDFSGGVSNTVLVGDVFSVENNGRYFLLKVTNINVTTDDNNDGYTFSVKK